MRHRNHLLSSPTGELANRQQHEQREQQRKKSPPPPPDSPTAASNRGAEEMGRAETSLANSSTSWEAPSALVLTHSRGQGVGESEQHVESEKTPE